MKFKKLFIALPVCLLIYFVPGDIFSVDIKKANTYYERYSYKYALDLYKKALKKRPSVSIAQKVADCYRLINDTENAEKAYAKVFTFAEFDPINYKYYADALSQNGKYEAAKENYLLYSELVPANAAEAQRMANATEAARMWSENPDNNVKISNFSLINSANSEFSPVIVSGNLIFSSDRAFTYNTSVSKELIYGWTGNPYLKLYKTDINGGSMTRLPGSINGLFHNGPATFSANGDTVYYTRTDLPKIKKSLPVARKIIYTSVKKGSSWTKAKILFGNGVDYSVQHPALSPDGNILYFASDMPGGTGGMDIYASKKKIDGTWEEPKNCGSNINTTEDEVFPYVRSDGKFYFSSKGNVGMGGLDIFTATGSFDTFSISENLKAPMNSSKDDFGIFFSTNLEGFLSSNRTGGKGQDDIYKFNILTVSPAVQPQMVVQQQQKQPNLQPAPTSMPQQKTTITFSVDGKVIEKNTGLPIPGMKIYLANKLTGKEIIVESDRQGRFNFDLDKETDYVLSADKTKYMLFQEERISTRNLKESTTYTVKYELEPSEDAFLVKLKDIYYNFDKWNIRADAVPELQKVVSVMNKLPSINIQLRSHTDSRGKAVYNQWLSQKRAESAIQYLERSGISSKRLSAIGLGETELVNRCKDGVVCSDSEHQSNRRTEFKVQKTNPALTTAFLKKKAIN